MPFQLSGVGWGWGGRKDSRGEVIGSREKSGGWWGLVRKGKDEGQGRSEPAC